MQAAKSEGSDSEFLRFPTSHHPTHVMTIHTQTAGCMQQEADTRVPDMSQQCCTVEEDVVSEGAEDVGGPAASTASLLGLPESVVSEILGE